MGNVVYSELTADTGCSSMFSAVSICASSRSTHRILTSLRFVLCSPESAFL